MEGVLSATVFDDDYLAATPFGAQESSTFVEKIGGDVDGVEHRDVATRPRSGIAPQTVCLLGWRLRAERSVRRIIRLASFVHVLDRAFELLAEAASWRQEFDDVRELVDGLARTAVAVFRSGSRATAELVLLEAEAVGRRVDQLGRDVEDSIQSKFMSGEAASLFRMLVECRRRILDETVHACETVLAESSDR